MKCVVAVCTVVYTHPYTSVALCTVGVFLWAKAAEAKHSHIAQYVQFPRYSYSYSLYMYGCCHFCQYSSCCHVLCTSNSFTIAIPYIHALYPMYVHISDNNCILSFSLVSHNLMSKWRIQLNFLTELITVYLTPNQGAQHCSTAAVWVGVHLPVISSASIASLCNTVLLPGY